MASSSAVEDFQQDRVPITDKLDQQLDDRPTPVTKPFRKRIIAESHEPEKPDTDDELSDDESENDEEFWESIDGSESDKGYFCARSYPSWESADNSSLSEFSDRSVSSDSSDEFHSLESSEGGVSKIEASEGDDEISLDSYGWRNVTSGL